MREFCFKQLTLVLVFLGTLIYLGLFPVWRDWVKAMPIYEPITLYPKGSVEKQITIVVPEPYGLNLVFDRAGHEYKALTSLLGDAVYDQHGRPKPSGIRVPISWDLRAVVDGKTVASGEANSFGLVAWGNTELDRSIGYLKVQPGKYIFRATVLRDIPELSHVKTKIALKLWPKAWNTWQIAFTWWGTIAYWLFVLPLSTATGLLLLWRASKHFKDSDSNNL